ncbi:hypothetical protein F4054_06085 [Candidatus Poribacteria bacterium]|nr:hypothetical protein [Candidatus Poribacteria bacterium]MYK21813.1 hypothetical protein [Candidatus Poribacteria bacterium]
MKWIFSFIAVVLISRIAVSEHTSHRNRESHDYDLETEENTYATAVDRDPGGIFRARSRTSSRHKEGDQQWLAVGDVKCDDAAYEGNWSFSNFVSHQVENVRGNASDTFKGTFFKNARVRGLREGVTSDSRLAIMHCGAASSITGWIESPSVGNLPFADSSIPW